MLSLFLKEKEFNAYLNNLLSFNKVIGPVAEKNKFIFSELNSYKDLRLDFDTTILPPKKLFFPPAQELLKFDQNGFKEVLKPKKMILFGVHFYDLKGIDMTDFFFSEGNKDINYLANREATTIVGSNIQSISKNGFWASIAKNIKPKGHDAFLTKIDTGYVFEILTPKGEDIIKYGNFLPASKEQINESMEVNKKALKECKKSFSYTPEEIATKVRERFNDEKLWTDFSKDCFSCGSCNLVCASCYCFDVQDKWNLDQVSGNRTRFWDGCLTRDFAQISLGGDKIENFRDKKYMRFRHRIMRKTTYLNHKLGGPACTGCGRCADACTADIADPVAVIKKIMKS